MVGHGSIYALLVKSTVYALFEHTRPEVAAMAADDLVSLTPDHTSVQC